LKIIKPQYDNLQFRIIQNSEIDIEKGKGYKLTEETRKNIQEKFIVVKPTTLLVDAHAFES
jgi:hypothetical protein